MNSGAPFTLPARFALKGHNGRYLKDVSNKGQHCLQFSSTDPNEVQSAFVAQEENGYYGIKSEFLGKFLKRRDGDNWIVANSPDCTDNNTLFWALQVHGNKITLHNKGNEATCGMLTADASNAWLSASGHTPVFEVIELPTM